ncbi:hypothetical protein ACIBKX_22385 [Streptomyces sp. NPDC050658]|uniref:hypothetical protein n=1 Tax=unclassified Streptomyces TaxID=2593676 RepID=UPI003426639B
MGRVGRGRAASAAVLALCVVAALPGQASAGTPVPYAYAEGAQAVDGSTSSTGSARLTPGSTYKSTLPRGGKAYYQLELGATESVYVSATAVPEAGSTVAYGDGIEVSLQDADGNDCDSGDTRFGTSQSPRPLTAWAVRAIGPAENRCKAAGTYYVVVERNSDPASSMESWDTELRVVSEPGVAKGASTTPPDAWDSASPVPPGGERQRRAGGTSFNDARALRAGVWGDRIKPGQTLFYRVPVDWGQQVSAGVELGGSSEGRGDFVTSALVMSLSNPVRARVDEADTAYDGEQKTTALDALAPVAYENRYSPDDGVAGMRFAGWYYLAVHLNPKVAKQFGEGALDLTLRVGVEGAAKAGPQYAGSARPGDEFSVSGRDEEAAASGRTADGDGGGDGAGDGTGDGMKLVAAGGFGGGFVLLGVLGVWTLVARRKTGTGAHARVTSG